MDLEAVLETLELKQHRATFAAAWDDSEGCFPYPHPAFVTDSEVCASRALAGLPAALDPVLVSVAQRVRAHAPLCHLTWHCYRLLFHCPEYGAVAQWPLVTSVLGQDAGVLWLLVTIASAPRMWQIHQARGIPAAVTEGMAQDYQIGVSRYARFHQGKLGCPHNGWYRNHFSGSIVRLGRLQYIANPWRFAVRVFRHLCSGQVLALSEPGVSYTAAGFVHGIPTHDGPEPAFVASLEFDGRLVRGNPILPTGIALSCQIGIDVSVWVDAVKRDDGLLAMHIPEGGGMTLDRCRESLASALPFFARHFPETPVKGVMCGSWIFSPEYESFYSPEANFVRLQREVYLFPLRSSGRDGVYFVFDRDSDCDPQELPRDTSLRRAMAERLASGGVLRAGGMFLLPDAVPRFGTQPYRSQPWVEALRGGDRGALAAAGICLL